MADDPCKDCINKAPPVTPDPIPLQVSFAGWMQVSPVLRQGLLGDVAAGVDDALAQQAMALLRWAIGESRRGRVILSADPETGELKRLDMPLLRQTRRSSTG